MVYALRNWEIRPDPPPPIHMHAHIDKIKLLVKCLRPKTKKSSKVHLVLASCYQCFIPQFLVITALLMDKLHNQMPKTAQWLPTCAPAFAKIKQILCICPILCSLNFSLRFILETDARERPMSHIF